MELNKYIDHTLLKPESTKEQILTVCAEAKEYNFASVCVNPTWVKTVSEALAGTDVMTCTVIGFPLGASTSEVKAFETKNAIENGADEIDMVINIAALIEGNNELVLNDIKAVVAASGDKTVKVIIETSLLNDEQKQTACELILEAKADFVKTSTGFNGGGATEADIKLFKKVVQDNCLIKASGGVRSFDDAMTMINAGANRIGTSGGVSIIKGEENNNAY